MTADHTCDRKGPSTRVIDETGAEPITRIAPTCSRCGVPQILRHEVPLASLRGQDIGAARNALPACRADSPETATAAVEVPDFGLVLITFAKRRSQHHRTVRWFWQPESAEIASRP